MTDKKKPGFPVVDKRAAAENTEAETSVPPHSEGQPPATSEASQEGSPAGPTEQSAPPDSEATATEEPEEALPDPAYLLTMVAMQMDTRDLMLTLTGIFNGHAWRAMGFVADPRTGEVGKDLPSAQLAIDSVQFLLSKVETGLPDEQRREMQRRMTDLRMNYIAKSREP